jgi:predicted membrane channel-forming protein YqfA (hemolysin III family)
MHIGLLGFFVVLALVALWLFALVSAIRNERLDPTMRIVWVIVIVFVNGIGALLYLLLAPNRGPVSDDSVENWRRRRQGE